MGVGGIGQDSRRAGPFPQTPPPSPGLTGERWAWRWGWPGLRAKCLPSLAPPALSLAWAACTREAPPRCGVGSRSGGSSDPRSPPTRGPGHRLFSLPDTSFHPPAPIPLARLTPTHPMNLLPGNLPDSPGKSGSPVTGSHLTLRLPLRHATEFVSEMLFPMSVGVCAQLWAV